MHRAWSSKQCCSVLLFILVGIRVSFVLFCFNSINRMYVVFVGYLYTYCFILIQVWKSFVSYTIRMELWDFFVFFLRLCLRKTLNGSFAGGWCISLLDVHESALLWRCFLISHTAMTVPSNCREHTRNGLCDCIRAREIGNSLPQPNGCTVRITIIKQVTAQVYCGPSSPGLSIIIFCTILWWLWMNCSVSGMQQLRTSGCVCHS